MPETLRRREARCVGCGRGAIVQVLTTQPRMPGGSLIKVVKHSNGRVCEYLISEQADA